MDGTGLDGFCFIHQGHLFFQQATHANHAFEPFSNWVASQEASQPLLGFGSAVETRAGLGRSLKYGLKHPKETLLPVSVCPCAGPSRWSPFIFMFFGQRKTTTAGSGLP